MSEALQTPNQTSHYEHPQNLLVMFQTQHATWMVFTVHSYWQLDTVQIQHKQLICPWMIILQCWYLLTMGYLHGQICCVSDNSNPGIGMASLSERLAALTDPEPAVVDKEVGRILG